MESVMSIHILSIFTPSLCSISFFDDLKSFVLLPLLQKKKTVCLAYLRLLKGIIILILPASGDASGAVFQDPMDSFIVVLINLIYSNSKFNFLRSYSSQSVITRWRAPVMLRSRCTTTQLIKQHTTSPNFGQKNTLNIAVAAMHVPGQLASSIIWLAASSESSLCSK